MLSDLHRLFGEGYMTLDPGDRRVVVTSAPEKSLRTARLLQDRRPVGPGIESGVGATDCENLEFHAYNAFQKFFPEPSESAQRNGLQIPAELDTTGTLYRFARNSIKALSFRQRPLPRFGLSLSNSLRNRSGVRERYLSVEPNPTCPM
jgi:hypothetical protein